MPFLYHIYFPGFVCFVLYYAKISGERLHDHWSSGYYMLVRNLGSFLYGDVSVMIHFLTMIISTEEIIAKPCLQ